MTKAHSINFTTPGTFGSGRVNLNGGYAVGMTLDAFSEDDESCVMMNVPAAQAHEIADWIKANVPEPRPVHRDWDSIPVGASFGFYDAPEDVTPSSRFPYTKLSETSYSHSSAGFNNDYTRNHPVTPSSQRLVVKPEPGSRAFIAALEPGTRFRHQPSKLGYIRLTDDKVWSESTKAPFPIADFGDVYPGADYFEVVD